MQPLALAFGQLTTLTLHMADDAFNAPTRLSATEIALLIRNGDLTVVQLAEACLARIGARPEIKAWAYIDRDLVLAEARRLDAVSPEKRSPLHGIPVGIKDIFETKGKTSKDLLGPNADGSQTCQPSTAARDTKGSVQTRTQIS